MCGKWVIVFSFFFLFSGIANADLVYFEDFSAESISLDFEDLIAGTDVSYLYTDIGITFNAIGKYPIDGDPAVPFSGAKGITSSNKYVDENGQIYEGPWRVISMDINASSPPYYSCTNGILEAYFVDPNTGNPTTTTQVGGYLYTHTDEYNGYWQMNAYDINNQLIETNKVFGGGGTSF